MERINIDLSQRVVVNIHTHDWTHSPLAGVERKYLERNGGEYAKRASTIVKYDPGSCYTPHIHHTGEEFLVLEGIFSDEHGDYPAGTYVRNPWGSHHAPYSKVGCIILVKLCQILQEDKIRKVINSYSVSCIASQNNQLVTIPLHSYRKEKVVIERWMPGTKRDEQLIPGGEEIFIIEGAFEDDLGQYKEGTWLRSPDNYVHNRISKTGCLIYKKTGHLQNAQ